MSNNDLPSDVQNKGLANNQTFVMRWGGHGQLFKGGFLAVPEVFLKSYSRLKPYALTVGEAMFTLQLMTFKWSRHAPFPSYKKLAERMGITDKMVRRYAANLEDKGYIRREVRKGRSNLFDLTPLFAALAQSADLKPAEISSPGAAPKEPRKRRVQVPPTSSSVSQSKKAAKPGAMKQHAKAS